jgi:hypothetical protein
MALGHDGRGDRERVHDLVHSAVAPYREPRIGPHAATAAALVKKIRAAT